MEGTPSRTPTGKNYYRWLNGDLADALEAVQWPIFPEGQSLATRKASAACLAAPL